MEIFFYFSNSMNLRPTLILSLFCVLLFTASCYKVEVEANSLPQGYSVAQIVGVWKITGMSSDKPYDWDRNGTAESDVYSVWTDCEKDNLYQFNSNYTGSFKLNCSSTQEATWRLNGTVMLEWATAGLIGAVEKIVYLTSNTMKTESTTVLGGQSYTFTKVWSLQ